jgi:MFS family permease
MYTFGSSGGQTFFISIFIPSIAISLGLRAEDFGFIYGAATIVSAVLLPFAGRLIDRFDLIHFGIFTGVMLTVACCSLALSQGLVGLTASLIAIRLFGQGLMTHTAMTATARYFMSNRGKALSITSLGHAAGEALLPLAAISLIGLIGWRWSFALSGLILGILIALTAAYQIRKMYDFRLPPQKLQNIRGPEHINIPIWSLSKFWWLLPSMIAAPFTFTALIFHQGFIAEGSQIPLSVFAASFVIFALMQVPGSVFMGRWIDKFTAQALLPWHLLPAIIGIAVFAMAGSPWAVLFYLAMTGLSNGAGATLRSAVIAEMVPVANIGTARSYATSAMILSTAAGPAFFSMLYAFDIHVMESLWIAVVVLVLTSLIGFIHLFRMQRIAR